MSSASTPTKPSYDSAMPRMRIAQIAPLYERIPPKLYGGTERTVSYITEELVRRGHDVTLFAAGDAETSATLHPACPQALRLAGKQELGAFLQFPMLSDVKRELSSALGILDPEAGVSQRATYIVDPQGIIRFVYVTDLNVGRSPEEVLRVLDGLQTDELCPCNWKKGEETLKAA